MDPTIQPVRRVVNASPTAVAEVLANGWLYATWVVGASRIRGVDPRWPQASSSIAHSVGLWPALLSDRTFSVAEDLPRRLELRARALPVGQADVVITIEPVNRADQSLVSIAEDVASGPTRLTPKAVRQWLIRTRNVEALRRLAMLAEGRSAVHVDAQPDTAEGDAGSVT
ncbi:MAG TPA: SRPBCC family protein [Actinomycetes bacterium]|nr:SRPBCC family protein [Actinomycetes bacterium]